MRLWFRPLALSALMLAAHPALGQESQVRKAQAALDAYADGDRDALETARIAAERATLHKKTSPKGSVWVLHGRVLTAIALDGGVPQADQVAAAVQAWNGAVERGAGKDAIAEDLARILSAATLVIRDDLEGRRIAMAWSLTEAAMTARALLGEVDWSDERLEGPLLRLATIVAAKAAQLDNAVTWFDELKATSGLDASAAVQVSAALEGGRDLDAAMAFLDPLLKERPLDPELLAQIVNLLVKNDQTERAVEYLRQASSQPGVDGTGSSLLLARLYLEVGLEEEARLAYQAALERNPESGEAWLPQARLLASHAATLEEQAKQTRGSKRRELLKQHQAALDEAVDLVHRARDAAGSEPDRDLLETLISVYESAGTGDVEAVRQSLQSLDE